MFRHRLFPTSTSFDFQHLGRVALSCLAAILSLGFALRPILTQAHPSQTIKDGFAFTTAASGLVATGDQDLLIGWHDVNLKRDEFTEDTAAGLAGFVVVVDGDVIIGNDDLGAVTLLQEGEAMFIPADLDLELQAINHNAHVWRIELGVGDGSDLDADQVDAQVDGNSKADDGDVRKVSLRTGIIPDGKSVDLGEKGENVPLVSPLLGDLLLHGNSEVDEGDLAATDGGDVAATNGSAFVAFVVVGPSFGLGQGGDQSAEPTKADTGTNNPTNGGGNDQNGGNADDGGNADNGGNGDGGNADNGGNGDNGGNADDGGNDNGGNGDDGGNADNGDNGDDGGDEADPVDTDGDGITDEGEINQYGTDPNNPDSDGDGLTDFDELLVLGLNTDPNKADTDGDGLTDSQELNGAFVTRPDNSDTDGDGLSDAYEEGSSKTNPTLADTDADGLDDRGELNASSNPSITDTDGDGLSDGYEVFTSHTNPATSDTDNDLLSDIAEMNQQTDANNPDTDGDGFIDGTEVSVFTNPLDPNDHP